MYTIDIDVGGTFTDGYFTNGKEIKTAKVLTTPHDISECIGNCVVFGAEAFGQPLKEFLRKNDVARVSTTVGTNLIIQAAGPKIGLLVTKGSEQTLYGDSSEGLIGSYVAEDMIIGIEEEVDQYGSLKIKLDREEVLAAVRQLLNQGARMIVVSFQNAWLNAENELKVIKDVQTRYPIQYLRSIPIQLGTDIVHVSDDHARTNSAIINAYIHSDMARSLYRAEDNLRDAGLDNPLLIVHASGGNARVAKTVALHTLNSGPAAAVSGAAQVAESLNLDHVITADMGGTSFDVALIHDRKPDLDIYPSVFGAKVGIPMIRVETIGGGGGSIARVENEILSVGPESAGASPGPICYDKGGSEPTVTDADLLLGYIDPSFFLGGRIELRKDLATRTINRSIADPLEITPQEAAWRIRRKLANDLAAEIKVLLNNSGYEPSEFTYFAMGGAGPLHACEIAELVGIDRVIAFPFGSVFGAYGSCMTDVRHSYMRSLHGLPINETAKISEIVENLIAQASTDMAGEGFDEKTIKISVEFDVENGKGRECVSWAPDSGPLVDFLIEKSKNGYIKAKISQLRVTTTSETPHPPSATSKLGKENPESALKNSRDIFWEFKETVKTSIYDRDLLKPGHKIKGPALVEGADSIYSVPVGWNLTVDKNCFYIMSLYQSKQIV